MTDLELTLKALQAGILPSFDSDEIKKLLETCDPKEARKMKRKFRKLWRKQCREEIRQSFRYRNDDTAIVNRIKESYTSPARRRRSVKNKLIND